MITIFLVEDERLVREGLKILLSGKKGFKIVGEAKTGKEALTKIKEKPPQIVLLDVSLSDISGLNIAQEILRLYPQIKIIVLTADAKYFSPQRLLSAGVSGYLSKEIKPDELVKAIISVSKGEQVVSPVIANQLVSVGTVFSAESIFKKLSPREKEIMFLTLRGRKIKEIAQELNISHKTISTYRSRVFNKLHIDNEVDFLWLAIKEGIIDKNWIK